MLFLGVLLVIIVLTAVIYMAVSKQSSFKVRIAALAALGVMILTVIICLFFIFGGLMVTQDAPAPPETPPLEKPPAEGNNSLVFIAFILFLVGLFVLVMFISFREQRKSEKEKKGKGRSDAKF
jgi:formate-dependent nitrite reductase membrane component NrfD